MSVQMVGIDYHRADVDIRAAFSFTKKNAGEAMKYLTEKSVVSGCVIISTCNRMELWVNTAQDECISLADELCELKGVSRKEYDCYFEQRSGDNAIRHLFRLACGLDSMILAEDQIVSQVKDALSIARENYCTDNVLEVLFRKAVTAAKKVKSRVTFTHGNATAVSRAVDMLKSQGYHFKNKRCMVIGNGEMGRISASTLREEGAAVTVTVRQYRSGVVQIPAGCNRINYGERMELLPRCDLVVSATASPNYTIRRELFDQNGKMDHPIYVIDLAVPRDVEPEVGEIENITLYDIDDFKITAQDANREAIIRAEKILDEEMEDFFNWYNCRDLIPRIQKLQEEAVKDLNLRISKKMHKSSLEEIEQQLLLEQIDVSAGKVVGKMMFGLRDHLENDCFRECLDGLEKLYE
ncbi:glutamyl-tRNA reductase [Blautia liquoris]|uniref:Glutamyl-tRNA reductase n=1 Tax=Blautia liquoris TaxID=2779518 RepID=A0A7M2RIU5_9FIRM|nr:glutamyl-tRNA reductase [Blautia liquoris]QOV19991.1 glutamyl-tRNA reductase [Blautia liquoris]